MAKKSSKTRKSKGASGADAPVAERMESALLRLVESQGWRDLSLAAIAQEAGVDLAEAVKVYGSKGEVLCGHSRALDAAVITSLKAETLEGSVRDRLFDLFMRRFDRMKPSRKGYQRLARELPWTPVEAMALSLRLRRSLSLMLETAGVGVGGIVGALRIEALGGAYAYALNAFFNDESDDLSATMAALDKALNRLESLHKMMQRTFCN